MDIRDQWLGLKELRKDYSPQSYAYKTNWGEHVPRSQRAEHTAHYLANIQWGSPPPLMSLAVVALP